MGWIGGVKKKKRLFNGFTLLNDATRRHRIFRRNVGTLCNHEPNVSYMPKFPIPSGRIFKPLQAGDKFKLKMYVGQCATGHHYVYYFIFFNPILINFSTR